MAARFPRFHVGVTPFKGRACACPRRFNPRTRVGCDVPCEFRPACCQCFNPRTRVGCDLVHNDFDPQVLKFQSTHPRGVRQPDYNGWLDAHGVSIHAPAWGATRSRRTSVPSGQAFQSTHPRGVRRACTCRMISSCMFQSTHPRGVRHGTTIRLRGDGTGFNPRTRVGCDWAPPTPWARISSFNPRTRVGCDITATEIQAKQQEFQSTHPRGVRLLTNSIRKLSSLFQSTHPRGVRQT